MMRRYEENDPDFDEKVQAAIREKIEIDAPKYTLGIFYYLPKI
ncbi:hypothetical protein [Sphaerospermopsis sp. LEGE 08334]|jgi:hypothetical protein|nr:hypothetical protein [Sphaerospermopsis sp. LEGE 08334]